MYLPAYIHNFKKKYIEGMTIKKPKGIFQSDEMSYILTVVMDTQIYVKFQTMCLRWMYFTEYYTKSYYTSFLKDFLIFMYF